MSNFRLGLVRTVFIFSAVGGLAACSQKTPSEQSFAPGVTASQKATVTNPVTKINGNKPQLSAKSWHYSHIVYTKLDRLNRAGTATAYLNHTNLGKSVNRERQFFKPTGWHNQPITVSGKYIFPIQNRGHLIAYTLSYNLDQHGSYQRGALGSSNNPLNLATQTDFANKHPMQDYEQKVRDALAHYKKVIYRVKPVFRGNELMPRGYWSQALSTDGKLKFNVYIHNVEPLVRFNYATGRATGDASMKVAYTGHRRGNNSFQSSGKATHNTTNDVRHVIRSGKKFIHAILHN